MASVVIRHAVNRHEERIGVAFEDSHEIDENVGVDQLGLATGHAAEGVGRDSGGLGDVA